MLNGDFPKEGESSVTTSLSPFLDRTVPDLGFSQLKGKLPLKTKINLRLFLRVSEQ